MARCAPPRDPWHGILNEVQGVSSSWSRGGRPASQKHPRCSEHSLPPRLHGPANPCASNRSPFRTKFTGSGLHQTYVRDATPPRTFEKIFCPQKSRKKSVLQITTVGKSSSRNAFLSGSQRHFGVRQKIDKFVKEILESNRVPTRVGCVSECCVGWSQGIDHVIKGQA